VLAYLRNFEKFKGFPQDVNGASGYPRGIPVSEYVPLPPSPMLSGYMAAQFLGRHRARQSPGPPAAVS
jgi:hypothetical protein